MVVMLRLPALWRSVLAWGTAAAGTSPQQVGFRLLRCFFKQLPQQTNHQDPPSSTPLPLGWEPWHPAQNSPCIAGSNPAKRQPPKRNKSPQEGSEPRASTEWPPSGYIHTRGITTSSTNKKSCVLKESSELWTGTSLRVYDNMIQPATST